MSDMRVTSGVSVPLTAPGDDGGATVRKSQPAADRAPAYDLDAVPTPRSGGSGATAAGQAQATTTAGTRQPASEASVEELRQLVKKLIDDGLLDKVLEAAASEQTAANDANAPVQVRPTVVAGAQSQAQGGLAGKLMAAGVDPGMAGQIADLVAFDQAEKLRELLDKLKNDPQDGESLQALQKLLEGQPTQGRSGVDPGGALPIEVPQGPIQV